MYYLVKIAPGKFENAWSLSPESDFAPSDFFGLARAESGLRVDGSFYNEVDGEPELDNVRYAEFLAAEKALELARIAEDKAKLEAEKALKDKIKAIKKADLSDVAKLADALLEIIKLIGAK